MVILAKIDEENLKMSTATKATKGGKAANVKRVQWSTKRNVPLSLSRAKEKQANDMANTQ